MAVWQYGSIEYGSRRGREQTEGCRLFQLTAAQVDKEGSVEVFVVDQGCVLPRAALVGQGEVTHVLSPPKHVARLLINQQFLVRNE